MGSRRQIRLCGWTRAAAVAVALGVLAGGCGGDDGRSDTGSPPSSTADRSSASTGSTISPSSTSTTTTSTSTTSVPATTSGRSGAPDAAEQEVIDRYLGYWAARLEANSGVPDPGHPGLAEFATGAQLEAAVSEAQTNLERGVAYRQREDSAAVQRIEVVSIDGNAAVVQECFVDDGLVVRQDTGEVVDDDITTHNVRADLTREDGGPWRVAAVRAIQVWEGVAGCALAS